MIKGSEKSDRFVVVAPVAILPNEFFGMKIMKYVHVYVHKIHLFTQEVSNRCQSFFCYSAVVIVYLKQFVIQVGVCLS